MNADQWKCTAALYMDFRKAFDTANHTCIIEKLPDFSIRNTELEWLTDYLFHRKQQVKINGYLSDAKPVTCGVPQGSILGPLLFLLLIKDLPSTIKSCQMILYADDAVLYYAHQTPEVLEQELNADANRVAGWLMKSCLLLNLKPGKAELVKYGTAPKVKSVSCKIEIKGSEVHENKGYEYLGVYLDSQLNLYHQLYKLVKRISNWVRLLARIQPSVTPVAAEKIYKSMINQIFHYCYPIYVSLSATQNDKLNSLQDRAKRLIGSTSAQSWIDIASQRNQFVAIDVFKSLHQLGNQIPYKYNWINHNINTRGNKSCYAFLKSKLKCLGNRFIIKELQSLTNYRRS